MYASPASPSSLTARRRRPPAETNRAPHRNSFNERLERHRNITPSRQTGSTIDRYSNRLVGDHATGLHRLDENASNGTDHGTASSLSVIGNAVKGGDLYGLQPFLNAADLDSAGNVKFTTDFRSVYATLLDKWMPGGDSQQVLGGSFAPPGFL